MYENDNMRKETDKLQEKYRNLSSNNSALSQTLSETQTELETLVADYEQLQDAHSELKKEMDRDQEENRSRL